MADKHENWWFAKVTDQWEEGRSAAQCSAILEANGVKVDGELEDQGEGQFFGCIAVPFLNGVEIHSHEEHEPFTLDAIDFVVAGKVRVSIETP